MSENDQEGEAGTTPWRTFHAEAIERCQAAGLELPHDDARRIVEEAAGFEGAEFALRLDEPATQRGVAHFDAMLERRVKGEPLQYVVGRWGFRMLDLKVDKRALIPRPETEVVTGLGLKELERLAASDASATTLQVVDLGTGSGAIGLSILAERTDTHVTLTDASAEALELAWANMIGLGRRAVRGTIREGSWFDALDPALRQAVHLVISNPPYIGTGEELPTSVQQWEPGSALFAGPTGMDHAEVLIAEAPDWLVPGGALVLELGATQLNAAAELARTRGYADVGVHKDYAGHDRALVARWPTGGSAE